MNLKGLYKGPYSSYNISLGSPIPPSESLQTSSTKTVNKASQISTSAARMFLIRTVLSLGISVLCCSFAHEHLSLKPESGQYNLQKYTWSVCLFLLIEK